MRESASAEVALKSLTDLSARRFQTAQISGVLTAASRSLAELKGLATSIPDHEILINSLGMQEAKDSSAIENIITTHDELFKDELLPDNQVNLAAKEVARYRTALKTGYNAVRANGLLSINTILLIQAELERNNAGFRKLPGTTLKNACGQVVYTPPQDPAAIISHMRDLERFINESSLIEADPLVKMALMHYQFESIHPFYDGNGRTGRILNVLYLVKEGLLNSPLLYLSRYIVNTKTDYYRLLQEVRSDDAWEQWIIYMLTAVDKTAIEAARTIRDITGALQDTKEQLLKNYKFGSEALTNTLFAHPYTKIEFLVRDIGVSRLTATRYLDALSDGGILSKHKLGRANYYRNIALTDILTRPPNF